MIPQGEYRAVATEGTFAESSNKGTPFIRVSFRVKEGPHDGTYVTWDGFFTDATTERTIESLRHTGCTFPGDDLTNVEGLGSKDCEIVVEHENYETREGEQKTRARVQWVNGTGGGLSEEQKMTGAKLSSFASKMKGAIVAQRKKAGVGATSPNSGAGRPKVTEDDRPDWAR